MRVVQAGLDHRDQVDQRIDRVGLAQQALLEVAAHLGHLHRQLIRENKRRQAGRAHEAGDRVIPAQRP